MVDEELCNTGLALSIGQFVPKRDQHKNKHVVCLDLTIPLHPKQEANIDAECRSEGSSLKPVDEGQTSKNNKICGRKKLRLSKEQSTLLEDSFKIHSTLNTSLKQALAKKLNLRPRQVEVWFQNRRARTKLKQTEVDYEFLKNCCASLSDENRRLKKELDELRSLNVEQPPLYIQLQKAATLTMCPSCENVVKAGGDGASDAAVKDVVLHEPKKTPSC
ncbi:hypothetical protein RJ639_015616 [Escallonia herrerae]|uniref:Homeobox domain-containing protein n=1 Tax=Escallonia herrerae TaxID=1293975 RepID=A0AA89AKA3_9ASTE|nr:hypothetical protein RJ639_015616 [Escallonia herrerae]